MKNIRITLNCEYQKMELKFNLSGLNRMDMTRNVLVRNVMTATGMDILVSRNFAIFLLMMREILWRSRKKKHK